MKDAKNIFVEAKQNNEQFLMQQDTQALLTEAQNLEKKTEDYYREKANKVTKDAQREILLKLAEEEKKHGFLIQNLIDFLSRPMTWIENAEFNHLEEY